MDGQPVDAEILSNVNGTVVMQIREEKQGEYIQVQQLSNDRKLQMYLSQSKQIHMPAIVTD